MVATNRKNIAQHFFSFFDLKKCSSMKSSTSFFFKLNRMKLNQFCKITVFPNLHKRHLSGSLLFPSDAHSKVYFRVFSKPEPIWVHWTCDNLKSEMLPSFRLFSFSPHLVLFETKVWQNPALSRLSQPPNHTATSEK